VHCLVLQRHLFGFDTFPKRLENAPEAKQQSRAEQKSRCGDTPHIDLGIAQIQPASRRPPGLVPPARSFRLTAQPMSARDSSTGSFELESHAVREQP
jgi:hypothetical protein